MIKKLDYKGFGEHLQEWDAIGVPYGTKELLELAEKYGTPVPGSKEWHEEFPPVTKKSEHV